MVSIKATLQNAATNKHATLVLMDGSDTNTAAALHRILEWLDNPATVEIGTEFTLRSGVELPATWDIPELKQPCLAETETEAWSETARSIEKVVAARQHIAAAASFAELTSAEEEEAARRHIQFAAEVQAEIKAKYPTKGNVNHNIPDRLPLIREAENAPLVTLENPMIKNERTLRYPLSEKFPELAQMVLEAKESNESWHAIRFSSPGEAIPLYRTKYFCPSCKHRGSRYCRETAAFMKCHACHTNLKLELIQGAEGPQDELGNFLTASKLYDPQAKARGVRL